jgi:Cdc6-like AAA superfamily ATPase
MSEPRPLLDGLGQLAETIKAQSRATPPRPQPALYALNDADVENSLPPEYVGAEPKAGLLTALLTTNTILIGGAPGTGKTRQLWGLARRWRFKAARNLIQHGTYVPFELDHRRRWRVVDRDAWAQKTMDEIVRRQPLTIISESSDIRANRFDRDWLAYVAGLPHALAVDDIGCIEPDQWVKEAIYEISTVRRRNNMLTIYTTNLNDNELAAAFGSAIASRLAGGEVFSLGGTDRRTA